MLFHTWPFVLFFLIAYSIHLLLKETKFRLPWLLAASYFFYAWFNPLYPILLLYATSFDYLIVLMMEKWGRKKIWLSISIVNSLALLGLRPYENLHRECVIASE